MTSPFEILPAIDLRGGRVVRLEQGDFARETTFSANPVAVARDVAAGGGRWLHVVDLDGARSGAPAHQAACAAIVEAVGEDVGVEIAGGLRTPAAVDAALATGARRVVIGTWAIRDPAAIGALVRRIGPERIVVALDVRDGHAIGHGWAMGVAGVPVEDALLALADAGVATFEVTAIDRDGMGSGPDLALYRRLVALGRGAIIASAGISSIDDVAAVRTIGCAGAIIGRAWYDGRLSLAEALRAASAESIPIHRMEDGEMLGFIRPLADGWEAVTIFGGHLSLAASAAAARGIVERDGLAALARRWAFRSRSSDQWQLVLIQEAWPGRVRLVEGPYPVPGGDSWLVTSQDLRAGDVLTLEPPLDAGLEGFPG